MKKSRNSIVRLSRYKDVLFRFSSLGLVKVFSDNLADAADVTPSQVRKDFSQFGIIGNKKGGYLIDELFLQINRILGKNIVHKVVIVGVGNLGTALLHYKGFEKEGIKIIAAFDSDLTKVNQESTIPIYNLEELPGFIKKNKVEIGIIAVPDNAAGQIKDILIAAGVKGILNFASIRLKSTPFCVINNVNLVFELENLIYFINQEDNS